MKRTTRRRRYFVNSFQTRFLANQAVYLVALVALLYGAAVWPLLGAVHDLELPLAERAENAQLLLFLHARVLPVLIPLTLLFLLHSVRITHRVAGPIYRFREVMKEVADGDLSTRVILRERDYLEEEVGQLNEMLERLNSRVRRLQEIGTRLTDQAEQMNVHLEREDRDGARECAHETRTAAQELCDVAKEFQTRPPRILVGAKSLLEAEEQTFPARNRPAA